jgi:hypothetical protein
MILLVKYIITTSGIKYPIPSHYTDIISPIVFSFLVYNISNGSGIFIGMQVKTIEVTLNVGTLDLELTPVFYS